jgi:uncharacterized membrane protein
MFSALAALPKAGAGAAPALGALASALRRMSTASPTGGDLKSVLAAAIPGEQARGRSGGVLPGLVVLRRARRAPPGVAYACCRATESVEPARAAAAAPAPASAGRAPTPPRRRRCAADPAPPRAAARAAQARLKKIKTELGGRTLGEVTVDQAIGGMRGIPVRRTGAGAGRPARRRARGPQGRGAAGGG